MENIPYWLPLLPQTVGRFFVQPIRGFGVEAVLTCVLIGVLALTACGQVVTVQTPTARATPSATPALAQATIPARPTVTRALPTPAPPDTATPSPTPIIHVIQPGETLIAIALQYGVTVAALQTANGISDPSTLQVNQELIVPTGEEDQSNNSGLLLATPTPVALAVEGLNCREDAVGSLSCLGEVVNSTETSIENAQVRLNLYTAAGEALSHDDVFTALDLIPSGQRSPFGVRFTSPPETYERFQATPIRGEASSEPFNRYAALVVAPVEAGPVGSLFEVSGSVSNPGQRPVTAVMVVVTTYDEAGRVSGYRQSRLLDDLPAGGSLEFAISLMPYGGVPSNYSVVVQGLLASP